LVTTTNSSGPYVLDDYRLINWFKSNLKSIVFVNEKPAFEAHNRTKELLEAVDKLRPLPLYEQKDEVAAVWRNLLGKAVVYLKSKDDREKFHDDEDLGVAKLTEFFNRFREFEPLLYGAGAERYRDHMAHMLSVFLTGEYLITSSIDFSNISVGDNQLPKEYKITPSEKEAMWCIMSLTHDLGYPMERIADISPKAERMLKEFGVTNVQGLSYPFSRSPLHDFVIQFISSDLQKIAEKAYVPHAQNKYFLKFAEAYERMDHGLVSCLVLMKNLVYFLETDYSADSLRPLDESDAKQFLIRRNILRPIASHSNDNIYYLTLLDFPFLLTIFDELHEWERPTFTMMFEKERPKTTVTVESLTEEAIHYTVKFGWENDQLRSNPPESKLKASHREICSFFMNKCERLSRILRSAVGGKHRTLTLTFEVRDELEVKSKIYSMTHQTPQEIRMVMDNKSVTWRDLSEVCSATAFGH
jgi:hypothetical protein